ncbi:MAG TPA: tandem-95 repeat protein, partial [Desulfobulbaceae bacterium]|nr:tandem-95 repeat protein [Desulfobulbaceae bacterium]
NDLPTVPGLSAEMAEDGEITFSVESLMASAVDVEDGTDLDFSGIMDSHNGDAWADNDGLIHFLPDADFFGTASFTYGVADSEAGVGAGKVTIEVAGENDAPVAMNDESILAWGNNSYDNVYGSAALLANDSDVDGDSLKIISLGQAVYGNVSLDLNGNIHYQAQSDNWVGVDSFTYTIDDGQGGQAEAATRVDVKLDASPDVYSEILFSQEDVIALIDQEELLVNDSDVDGDTLFISAAGNAEHGSVTLLPDGSIQFTPELNFNNEYPGQASFEYTVSDGISDPVTAVAFVDLAPVNDTPVLRGENFAGAVEDNIFSFTPAQLLANDFDVETTSPFENDSMTVTGVSGASHGSLHYDSGTGSIVYTPEANFNGVDTFRYQVTDSHGGLSEVESEISVRAVNDNPVAQEDRASGAEDSIWNRYSIAGLLGNDTDVDGDGLSLVDPYVSRGSARVRVSNGYLEVQPTFGENRVDVSYTVSDGHGGSADSRLIIDRISEHNFAPEFTGLYEVVWESGWETWFTFQAEDRNGASNSWAVDNGDIATISAAEVHGGRILTSTNNHDNFSFKFEGNFDLGSLILTATDYSGATGSIFVQISHLGGNGRHVYSPVIMDLDGDGVELLGIEEGVVFDWNRDGDAEASGWAAGDDGFLVYDYNQDAQITRADELMLREYLPGAETDLEGLRAFDSNEDGIFSGNDTSWNDFGVWQDRNSNGLTDEGEFHSLDELGIRDIELESNSNEQEIAGNTVYGTAVYHRQDGSTGEVGDVALRGEEIVFTQVDSGECETEIEPGTEDDVGDATLDTSSTGLAEAGAPHANGEDGTAVELESEPADISSSEYTETEPLPADGEEGVAAQHEADLSDVPMTATAAEDPFPASGAEEMIPEQEPELLMDEAEANRLAQQFQSDAAACPTGADFEQPVSVEIYHVDAVAADDLYQADDTQDELLALA